MFLKSNGLKCFVIAIAVLCFTISTALADWGAKDKAYLKDNGIVQGRGEGVDPLTEKDVTKAEVGIIAKRAAAKETELITEPMILVTAESLSNMSGKNADQIARLKRNIKALESGKPLPKTYFYSYELMNLQNDWVNALDVRLGMNIDWITSPKVFIGYKSNAVYLHSVYVGVSGYGEF